MNVVDNSYRQLSALLFLDLMYHDVRGQQASDPSTLGIGLPRKRLLKC